LYASRKDADSWKPGGISDITWESNQLARAQIYQTQGIPVEPCEPEVNSCLRAPGGPVALDDGGRAVWFVKTRTIFRPLQLLLQSARPAAGPLC
jgi:hypothetical protein